MSRYSVEDLVAEAGELAGLGVKALLLFGVPDEKDDEGSGAWDEDGIVQRALRALRAEHPGARPHHRRLPLRVHRARPLRRHPRRRGRERRDARAARADRGQPRRRRRRRRRAERHDGRARRRDPRGAARDADRRLRRQVRVRLLRPVPRRRRVDAVLRRPARLPDGSGERARGAARVRARSRRGRRRADGEAGAAVSRRDPRRPRALRLPRRRLQRLRRVRDGEGGGRGRPPRRAPGGARVADRDQARRRRPRLLLLDEGASRRGSEAALRPAPARGEADPGRRQLAGPGDAQRRARRADLRPQRQRLDDRGRRRQPLRRLGAELGAAALRPRRRGDARRDRRGGAARDDLRRADRGRGRAGGRDRRRRAVGRDGAPRLLRHRGGDERDPAGPRLHPPRPDHQVRRLLPRPLRRAARERRLRPRDARHPVQPRRADRARRRTPSSRPTTTSTRPRPRSSATARGWRRSSSSRWPGTWASSRRRPASSRRCAHSATPPARC